MAWAGGEGGGGVLTVGWGLTPWGTGGLARGAGVSEGPVSLWVASSVEGH